jgi:outer membrane biogenesis lipoprotein LolB
MKKINMLFFFLAVLLLLGCGNPAQNTPGAQPSVRAAN